MILVHAEVRAARRFEWSTLERWVGVFYDGWQGLIRVAVVGTAAYVCLVLLLRISGKRTLSKLNAFDFLVTVALGSTLATVLLSADVALLEGLTALVLLVVLQSWWPGPRCAVTGWNVWSSRNRL